MTTYLYLQINVIGIILLMIMYINAGQIHSVKNFADQKLFKLLIASVIAVLVFDSGMWYIDGKEFAYAKVFQYLTTTLYLILNPLTCFCWLLYGKYKTSKDKKIGIISGLLYCLPVIINAILVLASVRTGWIFYIDENNVYHRGEYIYSTLFLSFIYIFIMFSFVFIQLRNKQHILSREMYYYLFLFPIPPMIGAILQMMFYGTSLIWVGMILSIFIVFINLQNKQIYIDSLTGCYNRCFFDSQFNASTKLPSKANTSFALMIDLDNFKSINDTFGHLSGDLALIVVAKALRSACGKTDYVMRFGGDEFLVVGECNTLSEIGKKIAEIEKGIIRYGSQSNLPYEISISIGSGHSTDAELHSITSLIKAADHSMYVIKNKKKNTLPKG